MMHLSDGCPHPLGPTVISTSKNARGVELQSINLAVLSHVRRISLCLFAPLSNEDTSFIREVWQHVRFEGSTGSIRHIRLDGIPRGTAYTICVPTSNGKHRLLTDVYAPSVESWGASNWMRIPGEDIEVGNDTQTNPLDKVRAYLKSFRTLSDLGIEHIFRPARFEVDIRPFDWGGYDKSPAVTDDQLVVYEAHARALGSDGTLEGGSKRGEYLKWLGVTAVQLMPVFEFAEGEMGSAGDEENIVNNARTNNEPGEPGMKEKKASQRQGNQWGYAPLSFFAPMNRYARRHVAGGPHALKTFVRSMHAQGILVFLDVVYNHTSNASCALHFLDVQHEYYVNEYATASNSTSPSSSKEKGKKRNNDKHLGREHKSFKHCNYSACGNTISANARHAQDLIVRSLRHFVKEYKVDGFRIDAAGILCRDVDGTPMKTPPVLEQIVNDKVLSNTRFIVEGWDAGDQIGSPNFLFGKYPYGDRFREWNPVWRDTVRSFFKHSVARTDKTKAQNKGSSNDTKMIMKEFQKSICGNPHLYGGGERLQGVNFVSCHDGFCMADVVSFSRRVNKDGYDEISFNCGHEGNKFHHPEEKVVEDEDDVMRLRCRTLRNFVTALTVSRGVPMILQGDEVGFSKQGNSNTYNDPEYFAARLPSEPQICTDREALVQFVHFMFKLRNKLPRWTESDISWIDSSGEVITKPENYLIDEGKNEEDRNDEDEEEENDVDDDSKCDPLETELHSKQNERQDDSISNDNNDENVDMVAFLRPSVDTLSQVLPKSPVDAVFVCFNVGSIEKEIMLPNVRRNISWAFQVETYSKQWKQDSRKKWKSGERISLRSKSAIVFTGKVG